MLNALSVDVEDYFHVEAFSSQISREDWHSYECRVEINVDLTLEILSKHQTLATFYILGCVAERYPRLVRKIADAGHEIGCHGYAHQRIHNQAPEDFREDVRTASLRIMDQIQKPVCCYRAPSFSVVESTLWALDVLAEEGIRIDSSIFPVKHDLYGIPDSGRFPYWHGAIFEFPLTTIRVGNLNVGVGGGGYLRLLPYAFTRWAIRRINEVEKQPVMVYFHPWELDPEQPRISAPLRSRMRHYTNLKGMQRKIERLLKDFRFTSVSDVCNQLQVYKNPALGFTEKSSIIQS